MIVKSDGIIQGPPGSSGSGTTYFLDPRSYSGASDDVKIQAAITAAVAGGYIGIIIPPKDSLGNPWLLVNAILLPSNFIVYLYNCYIKLSNTCRDNFFRSNNIGFGISAPTNNSNIHIIGVGNSLLEGASNPRATGGEKALKLNPVGLSQSYGTDAGVAGQTQVGDWRNYSIYFGYVDNFSVGGFTLKDMHMWGIVPERSTNGIIWGMTYNGIGTIGGKQALNQAGVQVAPGCSNITICDQKGYTADDLIAIVSYLNPTDGIGTYGTLTVTGGTARPNHQDDIHDIIIDRIDGCSGTEQVRLLDCSGLSVYTVSVTNVKDAIGSHAAPFRTIYIGVSSGIYASTYGNMRNITIQNIISSAQNPIQLDGGLINSNVGNIIKLSTANANSCLYYSPTNLGHAGIVTYALNPS